MALSPATRLGRPVTPRVVDHEHMFEITYDEEEVKGKLEVSATTLGSPLAVSPKIVTHFPDASMEIVSDKPKPKSIPDQHLEINCGTQLGRPVTPRQIVHDPKPTGLYYYSKSSPAVEEEAQESIRELDYEEYMGKFNAIQDARWVPGDSEDDEDDEDDEDEYEGDDDYDYEDEDDDEEEEEDEDSRDDDSDDYEDNKEEDYGEENAYPRALFEGGAYEAAGVEESYYDQVQVPYNPYDAGISQPEDMEAMYYQQALLEEQQLAAYRQQQAYEAEYQASIDEAMYLAALQEKEFMEAEERYDRSRYMQSMGQVEEQEYEEYGDEYEDGGEDGGEGDEGDHWPLAPIEERSEEGLYDARYPITPSRDRLGFWGSPRAGASPRFPQMAQPAPRFPQMTQPAPRFPQRTQPAPLRMADTPQTASQLNANFAEPSSTRFSNVSEREIASAWVVETEEFCVMRTCLKVLYEMWQEGSISQPEKRWLKKLMVGGEPNIFEMARTTERYLKLYFLKLLQDRR